MTTTSRHDPPPDLIEPTGPPSGAHGKPCGSMAGPVICSRRPARLYTCGWRCDDHSPARVAERPDSRPPYVGSLAWFHARSARRQADSSGLTTRPTEKRPDLPEE